MVECTVRGVTSANVVEEHSSRRALRCDTCCRSESRQPGAEPWRQRYISTASRNETRSGIRSRCNLRSNGKRWRSAVQRRFAQTEVCPWVASEHRQELRSRSQTWKTPEPRWTTASRRLTQTDVCFVVVEGQRNTSNMSEWLGYASSGQRQWKYRDRTRNWQATRDQSEQPTDRKIREISKC